MTNGNSAELLPCPCCGGAAYVTEGYTTNEGAWPHGAFHRVYCGSCQLRQLFHRTELSAIKSWNKRHALSVCADGSKGEAAQPIAYLSTDPAKWDRSRIKKQGDFTVPVYAAPTPERADANTAGANHAALIAEILAERQRQDAQWGGATHDDEHSTENFFSYMRHQMVMAGREVSSIQWNVSQMRESIDDLGPKTHAIYRSRLVKIAALAVAAIQSIARKNPQLAATPAPSVADADAEKDAALTDEQIIKLWYATPKQFDCDDEIVVFARAILAAGASQERAALLQDCVSWVGVCPVSHESDLELQCLRERINAAILMPEVGTEKTISLRADAEKDVERYRWIATLQDWGDIERMCWSSTADSAQQFKADLDKYIDAKILAANKEK